MKKSSVICAVIFSAIYVFLVAVIRTAVYIAAGFQIITSGSLPDLSFISVLYTVLAVSVPVAEILILYKPEKNKLKK